MPTKTFKPTQNKGIRAGDFVGHWDLESEDTGLPLILPRSADKTIQIFAPADGGAWDGATARLLATCDPDMQVWFTAYDMFDTNIEQTDDAKGKVIAANCFAIKPEIEGAGVNTKIRFALTCYGENK